MNETSPTERLRAADAGSNQAAAPSPIGSVAEARDAVRRSMFIDGLLLDFTTNEALLDSLIAAVRTDERERTEARYKALAENPAVQRTLDWWDDAVSSEQMSEKWGNGSFEDDERLIAEALRDALKPSDEGQRNEKAAPSPTDHA